MMHNAGSMDRTKYLGGSDVAGILGISPWRTPLEVYLDKVQPRIKPVAPSKQKVFTRGQRMEPYVIDLLSEETGLEIIHRGNRYIHRDYGFIAAEIDAEAASGENIEIKTVSPFKAKEWGEVQTDAIPVHYTAQAMHGLMVTGKQVCVFGVLIGGDDFRIYRVERDEETIQAILEKEIAFWDRVINLNPPEATTVSDISLMFEKDAGSSIEADGKALALFNDLRDMKSRYKSLGEEIAVSEEKLKLYMQEHSILTLDGKTICTWKSQVSNRFDKKLFQVEHPELYEKFKTSTTSRVFRMK
ncbi:endonuclease [Salmonella enterica subsp. enterica serovar Anatum]|uniref:Exonuclease n=6 Tax=root TaxID=1 RepID=Q858E0_BPE15|nr:YqaJ viral recombinase family protein [Salmonella enterica]NP_848243.1 RecE-like recombination exonuclease [Salmonella phage epsilon15]EAB6425613.1 endonuclease [Salmonella enterica subsp. enterica serovar Amsterdam]EBH8673092.1 endonuclease [Salmonella enterica subsp. enterica serovar Lexington]EBH9988493.1 endonuclease [Salmonella enterica subsp. enterica serovar Amager]EBV1330334.1 endonuclease [Salmonella enterica subsp. enterica serovar Sinstorf]EBY1463860.1 endonuclease [Salmonella e